MKIMANQDGFTYILALTIVMIMGIMLGMVGQSWKTVKQREQEKELLFRGSQIKEAIENWNNLKYPVSSRPRPARPLNDLKDLLLDTNSLTKLRYLSQSYAAVVDDKNPKCAPDCAKLKIYQDPMTGREWTVIRGNVGADGNATLSQGGNIIGIASKSDETPFRTDFKDTALENLGVAPVTTTAGVIGTVGTFPLASPTGTTPGGSPTPTPGLGDKVTKYSQWKFIYDPKNDHTKLYKAYHENW